jgi:hypothetical protein
MKNNTIIVGLLVILFFVELSNQYWMISINNKLKDFNEKMSEYLEPTLPEWESEQNRE